MASSAPSTCPTHPATRRPRLPRQVRPPGRRSPPRPRAPPEGRRRRARGSWWASRFLLLARAERSECLDGAAQGCQGGTALLQHRDGVVALLPERVGDIVEDFGVAVVGRSTPQLGLADGAVDIAAHRSGHIVEDVHQQFVAPRDPPRPVVQAHRRSPSIATTSGGGTGQRTLTASAHRWCSAALAASQAASPAALAASLASLAASLASLAALAASPAALAAQTATAASAAVSRSVAVSAVAPRSATACASRASAWAVNPAVLAAPAA